MLPSRMTWQIETNFKEHESSLCELLIIRSLIDLTKYDTENGDWKEFVTEKNGQFIVKLDYLAAMLGNYSWKPILYSEKFSSDFKEDTMLSEILYDFVRNKRKRIKIPKSTNFFSQSNYQLRQKIINNCLTKNVLEKARKKFGIFNISDDGIYVTVKTEIIDSFDPARQIDYIITKSFPDPLPSFLLMKKRSVQKIRKSEFDIIKNIQNNLCFFCKRESILVQDHYIPDHFVHETKPSNIVGACNECNRKKWDIEPPNGNDFDLILKRNKKHFELMESDYDEKEYVKKYLRFEKITNWKA